MLMKKPRSAWHAAASVLVGVATVTGVALTQVGMASASEPQLTSNPTESGPVSIKANVSGTDAPGPTIECSWVLGDQNPSGGAETQQYSFAIGANVGSTTGPNFTQPEQGLGWTTGPNPPTYSNNTAGTGSAFIYGQDITPGNTTAPCTSANTAGSQPTMAAGSLSSPTATGVTIYPNAFDNPAPRRVELWSAVDNASSVIFDVFYPDGLEDTEVGGVELGTGYQACSSYGTSGSLLTNMFAAAGPNEDNQVSANAIHNTTGTGIVDLCNENQKQLWHQAFTISKDDPNGTYTVEVRANNAAGGTSTAYFSFVVDPFIALAIDFSSLTFNNNGNGVYEVSGDTVFAPPNSTNPTVTNGGNSGEQIGLNFTKLTYQPSSGSAYYISQFNANLGYNASDVLSSPVSVPAGTTTYIPVNSSGAQLVCPNDDSKLDLSVDPPSTGLPAGAYTGTLTVWGQNDVPSAGNCPTDDGHPYVVGSTLTKSIGGNTVNYGNGSFKSLSDDDQYPLYRT